MHGQNHIKFIVTLFKVRIEGSQNYTHIYYEATERSNMDFAYTAVKFRSGPLCPAQIRPNGLSLANIIMGLLVPTFV